MENNREITRLAWPALGALAADPLVSLIDTAFVGRLGAAALGGLGVASAVFAFLFVSFNFLSTGTTSLVANQVGSGDRDGVGATVGHAVWVGMTVGVLVALILAVEAEVVVGWMGGSGDVQEAAGRYLRIRALAAPAVMIVMVGHGSFRGFQDTRTPLLVTVGFNAVNLVLDPLLIFGFGFGIAGAAWATVVAQWAGAIWFLGLFRRQGWVIGLKSPTRTELKPLIDAGWPLTIRTLSLVGIFTLATSVAARLGTVQVAAHQVLWQWTLFLALAIDALAVAGQALVGRMVGSGDVAGVKRLSWRLLRWGFLAGIGLGMGVWLLGGSIAALFSDEAAVESLIRQLLPVVALIQPLGALVFVADGLWMGAGAFRFLAAAVVASAAITGALLLSIPGLGWGLAGVWWAIVVLMVARGGMFLGRYLAVGEIA